jgi:hypothetical protein
MYKENLLFKLEFCHAPGHHPKSNNKVIFKILHLKLDKSFTFYNPHIVKAL